MNYYLNKYDVLLFNHESLLLHLQRLRVDQSMRKKSSHMLSLRSNFYDLFCMLSLLLTRRCIIELEHIRLSWIFY